MGPFSSQFLWKSSALNPSLLARKRSFRFSGLKYLGSNFLKNVGLGAVLRTVLSIIVKISQDFLRLSSLCFLISFFNSSSDFWSISRLPLFSCNSVSTLADFLWDSSLKERKSLFNFFSDSRRSASCFFVSFNSFSTSDNFSFQAFL